MKVNKGHKLKQKFTITLASAMLSHYLNFNVICWMKKILRFDVLQW